MNEQTGLDSAESLPIPSPWTPIELTAPGDAGLDIGVVGRTYGFDRAPFPTSIHAAGRELLAGPIRVVASVDGQPVAWTESGVTVHRYAPDRTRLLGWCGNDQFNLSVNAVIEFDGMIRFDAVLTPHGTNSGVRTRPAPRLDGLVLDIPLAAELARLYTYWPVADTGVVQTGGLKNSGAIPDAGFAIPFKPFVWLGWEDGGLTWFAESPKGWQTREPGRVLEVVRVGDAMVLRVHLIDGLVASWQEREECWAAPLPPLTFTFGLQATPVKPLPKNLHEWRVCHTGHIPREPNKRDADLDRYARLGVKTLVWHEAWNPIQNYPEVFDPAVLTRDLAGACHARGIRILLYFGYEFSTLAPEWTELHDRILVKNTDGGYTGGWDRKPPQRDYIVCYNNEWRDRFLAKLERLVDAYDIDGVYLDGTAIPWGCANTAHGCGFRDAEGKLQVTYPLFAARDTMRRLYSLFEPRGGYVNPHLSCCCCTPVFGFSHSYWDGEQLGGKFDMELASFRAEFMGSNFGVPAEFLGPFESLGLCLLHNVRPRPQAGNIEKMAPVWDAMTRFGVSHADWHPYWDNAALVSLVPETPHVKASFYRRPDCGKLLLVVANLSAESAAEVTVQLHAAELGLPSGTTRAANALTGEALACPDARITLALPPLAVELITVE